MAVIIGNVVLFTASVAMLAFGTINVVMKDWQTTLGFYEPYLWSFLTFLGQSLFLPIYWLKHSGQGGGRELIESTRASSKPQAPLHAFALNALFAYAALCLVNICYAGLPGSIVQMLKGVKLTLTTILNIRVLERKLHSYQILGVALNLVGVVLVCVSAANDATGWASTAPFARYLLIGLCSCLVGSVQYVWEEKTMKQYMVEPDLMVAMEGACGTVYGIILLTIAYATHAENVFAAFAEAWHMKTVFCAMLAFWSSTVLFAYSGLIVTNQASSMLRSLLDLGRTSCIWVVEMLCHWHRFDLFDLIGLLVMIMGTLIYTEIIMVPYAEYDAVKPLLPRHQSTTSTHVGGC